MSYADNKATALRIIQEKGTPCLWNVVNNTADSTQPWKETAAGATSYATNVVIFPFDSVARRTFGYAQGTTVAQGTVMGYVPGSTEFTPSLRDTITVGATTYVVEAFDVLNPNDDIDIIYVVEMRR